MYAHINVFSGSARIAMNVLTRYVLVSRNFRCSLALSLATRELRWPGTGSLTSK